MQIERIETAGPDSRARRLVFSDGTDRLTSASVVKSLGLEDGQPTNDLTFEASLHDAEAHQAKERAFRVLGYRERSSDELRRRLIDDGYPAEIVEELLNRLEELGLVDDERFASMWVRSRVAAGIGQCRIRQELKERGIVDGLARQALDEALEPEDEVERAVALLRGARASNRKERDKLIRRLVSRGYDLSTALSAVDRGSVPDE